VRSIPDLSRQSREGPGVGLFARDTPAARLVCPVESGYHWRLRAPVLF